MTRIKKAKYIQILLEPRETVDVARLLRGEVGMCTRDQAVARVLHHRQEYLLNTEDLLVLSSASSQRWCHSDELARECGVDLQVITRLIHCGLLIEDNTEGREALTLQERIASIAWDSSAFYYHFATRWSQQSGTVESPGDEESARRYIGHAAKRFGEHIDEFGSPPSHFHSVVPRERRIVLGEDTRKSALTDLLNTRSTTRLYDTQQLLAKSQLNILLRTVFGCQGYTRLSDGLVALKKTSPSGGAMHPVEVYPLVIGVDGVDAGLYHYHVGDHALEPMQDMDEAQARRLVSQLTAGQKYYASAHVVFLYTARFQRNFWKYRKHQKAYKVLLMDLAHLSQSLYLMCTDMRLGAFFTAACNDLDMDALLGIDGIEEGALAMGGCGIPLAGGDSLKLDSTPYTPGKTDL